MYFSNIANEELQHFHKTAGADFSMSLTQILSSDLFSKESLGNNIYRIYPMFYCRQIISSNDIDKIIDNRCLIVTQKDQETYLSFITNDDKSNVFIDEDILDIKKIGENLDVNEFNALVYRLRKLGVINGHLDFEKINDISGEYGDYIFNNVKGQLKNDVGIIINNEIKNNPITVKLQNPFFLDAKYILTFTVTSLTGANICDEQSRDFKTIESFDIELVEDNEVSIDLSNYINDSVLLFDFTVAISFDTPEIVNGNFDLTFTSDNHRISLGEDIHLKATLTSDDNVSGYIVKFFEDGQLIGSEVTDANGVASITYRPQISSNHSYSCSVLGLSRNINILVYNKNTKLLLITSDANIRVDNQITLTGCLLDYDDNPLVNMPVKLYENNNLIHDDITTDSNGEFTKSINHNVCGSYSYRVEYSGTNGYLPATSILVNVAVNKYVTDISLSTNVSTVYLKQSGDMTSNFVVSGNLTKEGVGLDGAIVELYNNGSKIANLTTNDGEFRKTLYPNGVAQTYNLQVKYAGTDKIQSANSNIVSVTARKIKTYLAANVNKNTVYLGQSVIVSGRLTDEFGDGIAGCNLEINDSNYGGTTDSNGYFSYSYPLASRNIGSSSIVVKFNGYKNTGYIGSSYERCRSEAITVDCVKYPVTLNILNNEIYDVGDTILIEATSDDSNFNPVSVNVTFDGTTSNVATKDSNGRFVYTIPNIDAVSAAFNIYASIDEDSTHDDASDTKTITVYRKLQHLLISKSGNNLVIVGKDRNNHNTPHEILNGVTIHYNEQRFSIENQIQLDDGGSATINLTNSHIQGSVYIVSNAITSNTITW